MTTFPDPCVYVPFSEEANRRTTRRERFRKLLRLSLLTSRTPLGPPTGRDALLIDGAMCNVHCIMKFWLSALVLWSSLCLAVRGSRVKNVTSAVTRQIRSVGFPGGSGMGIFFAISIPLDIPNKAVSVSFYFEANYALPGDKNSSNFEEYFGERSFDRKMAYNIVENKLERAGYPGRVCLMRAICDAAKDPVTNNGIIGDLLHIILTPSSSKDENLADEIREAEYEKNCENQYGECPINVIDLISDYI